MPLLFNVLLSLNIDDEITLSDDLAVQQAREDVETALTAPSPQELFV